MRIDKSNGENWDLSGDSNHEDEAVYQTWLIIGSLRYHFPYLRNVCN